MTSAARPVLTARRDRYPQRPLHSVVGADGTHLPGRLEAEGIISPCTPHTVAPGSNEPTAASQGWDLNLSLARGDLTPPPSAC
jgi:hypothetical protein